MKAIAIFAAAAVSIMVSIADPASAYNRRADKPPAGDCRSLAARYGAGNVWMGRYSGFMSLENMGKEIPFANQGCFASEAACRRWQNENMTFTRGGSLRYTSCKRGV